MDGSMYPWNLIDLISKSLESRHPSIHSPDELLIAAAGEDAAVRIWSLRHGGPPLVTLPLNRDEPSALAFLDAQCGQPLLAAASTHCASLIQA